MSENARFNLGFWAQLLTFVTAIFSIGISIGVYMTTIQNHEVRILAVEEVLKTIGDRRVIEREEITEIKSDIKYMNYALQEIRTIVRKIDVQPAAQ